MKCVCVQCFKRFEGRNIAQEFCSPECRYAFKVAELTWETNRLQALRENGGHIPGAVPCPGGWRAVDRGLSDGSDLT